MIKGLLFVFFIAIFLSILFCNLSFAQELQYSFGPICNNNKVTCKNSNEVPTCLALASDLSPRIHIETTKEGANRFQPACGAYPYDSIATCIDVETGEFAKDVIVECIEPVKCQLDKNTNKAFANCSSGRVPKCLGSDSEPNCADVSLCGNGVPYCDEIWEAILPSSPYQ